MRIENDRRALRRGSLVCLLFALAACHDQDSTASGKGSPLLLGGENMVSTDPAGLSPKRDARISHDGGNVYVVWTDVRTGTRRLRYNASFDGGATYQIADLELPAFAGTFGASDPTIASDGLTVHVAFEDDGADEDEIGYIRSTNGGMTWSTPVRLNHGPIDEVDVDHPKIACVGNDVYVVWEDERADFSTNDVYINVSNDGGVTWLPTDVRLDDGPAGTNAGDPEICADGTNVYVAWDDDRNFDLDVYFNGSNDSGSTFLGEVRLDTPATIDGSGGDSDDQRIACSGLDVFVVWDDERAGIDGDIYLNSSSDGGKTWMSPDVRVDHAPSGVAAEDPDVDFDGSAVHVVWEDERNDLPNSQDDIYYNRSADGGATWSTTDLRLDTDPQTNDSDEPFIRVEDSLVFVVWDDSRDGESIRLNYSTDGGASFQPSDIRLDEAASGSSSADEPVLSLDEGVLQTAWLDTRIGPEADVYVNSASLTSDPVIEE